MLQSKVQQPPKRRRRRKRRSRQPMLQPKRSPKRKRPRLRMLSQWRPCPQSQLPLIRRRISRTRASRCSIPACRVSTRKARLQRLRPTISQMPHRQRLKMLLQKNDHKLWASKDSLRARTISLRLTRPCEKRRRVSTNSRSHSKSHPPRKNSRTSRRSLGVS